MKNVIAVVFCIVFSTAIQSQDQTKLTGKVKVEVDGLSCPFCAYGLEKKLKNLDGVTNIKVDIENG
ncbi:MAG: heavy-metal-associated domain-containing protein, partial [Fulvivirga sp.]|nr:heavy-metal-associated domain-containing protein [Fulvivirga sp.]